MMRNNKTRNIRVPCHLEQVVHGMGGRSSQRPAWSQNHIPGPRVRLERCHCHRSILILGIKFCSAVDLEGVWWMWGRVRQRRRDGSCSGQYDGDLTMGPHLDVVGSSTTRGSNVPSMCHDQPTWSGTVCRSSISVSSIAERQ